MRRVHVMLVGKTPLLVALPWGKKNPPEARTNRPDPHREAESFLFRDPDGLPAVDGEDLLNAIRDGFAQQDGELTRRVRRDHILQEAFDQIEAPNGFAPLLRLDDQPIELSHEVVAIEDDDYHDRSITESEFRRIAPQMLVVRSGREDIRGTVALPRVEQWAVRLTFLYDETKVSETYREEVADALQRAGDLGVGAFCPRDHRGSYGRFYPAEWREEVVAQAVTAPAESSPAEQPVAAEVAA